MEDISNHIPCELCQELIHIDNYQNHTDTCIMNGGSQLLLNMVEGPGNLSFNNILRLLNTNVEQGNETDVGVSNNHTLNENTEPNVEMDVSTNENSERRINQTEIFSNISEGIVLNIIYNILGVPNSNNQNLSELIERVGVVEKGIDNIDEVSCLVSGDEKVNCPICQVETKTPVRKTLCNHSFCDSCITHWLSKSKRCPSCMQDLEDLFKENN